MEHEFMARSRFVEPIKFGGDGDLVAGDLVEAWLDNVRVKVRLTSVEGDALAGTVEEMADDCRTLSEHAGLTTGAAVEMRQQHVRSQWKTVAA